MGSSPRSRAFYELQAQVEHAICEDDAESLNDLMSRHPYLKKTRFGEDHNALIHLTARYGSERCLCSLLGESPKSIDIPNHKKETPFLVAAKWSGDTRYRPRILRCMRILIIQGTDLLACNQDQQAFAWIAKHHKPVAGGDSSTEHKRIRRFFRLIAFTCQQKRQQISSSSLDSLDTATDGDEAPESVQTTALALWDSCFPDTVPVESPPPRSPADGMVDA